MAKTLRIMLVDESPGRTAILEQALNDAGFEVVARVDSCERLHDLMDEIQPDVVIVDMESPGRDTLEHMRIISRDQPRPIVMFAEKSEEGMIEKAIRAGVSAYVVDGLNASRVKPIVDVAIARFREFHALRTELEETKTKLSERKTIERAKGLLMEKRGMNEDAAYKALRKMAMDRNMKLAEAAENVIAIVDLLG